MCKERWGEGRVDKGRQPPCLPTHRLMAPNMASLLFGVEKMLKDILVDISETYNIPFAELEEKYLIPKDGDEDSTLPEPTEEDEVVSKAKPKSKGKAKVVDDDDRPKCAAKTAKGAPCKNLSLAGLCYCRVHQTKYGEDDDEVPQVKSKGKKDEGESSKKKSKKSKKVEIAEDEEEISTPPTRKSVKKAPGAPKKAHTHKIGEGDDECSVCEKQGDVSKKLEDEYEADQTTIDQLSSILDELDGMGEEDSEEETEEMEDEEIMEEEIDEE
jgi:hypothetical protein